jgi:hypothetical protein
LYCSHFLPEFTLGFLVGFVLLIYLVFCVALFVFTFWVLCCDVCYGST